MLDAVGRLVAGLLGELPAVLALGVGEQAAEVRDGPPPRLGAGEAAGQPPAHGVQFIGPIAYVRGRRLRRHGSASVRNTLRGRDFNCNCSTRAVSR